MSLLTLSALQTDAPAAVRRVEIPERAGHVYVRQLNADEWDRWERSLTKRKGRKTELNIDHGGVRARFAALVCCNETGQRIFAESDAPQLGRLPVRILDRIWQAGYDHNQMTDEGDGSDDPAKNSEPAAAANSSNTI